MTEKERSRPASWHCRADKKKRRSVREEGEEGKERKNKKRIEIHERKNGMMVGKRYKSGTKICVFEKSCWQHREPSLCAVLGCWWCWWCCWCRRHGNVGAPHQPRRPCCGRAQVRQPVIMVGATASGPSCKKIGRRDLSRVERKARRTYMRGSDWLNIRQKACRCNLQSSGAGATGGAHTPTSSCTIDARTSGGFRRSPLIRDKRLCCKGARPGVSKIDARKSCSSMSRNWRDTIFD